MKKNACFFFVAMGLLTPFSVAVAVVSEDGASATGTFSTPGTSTGTDPSAVSKGSDITPPANWTVLEGTVKSVETTSNHLRLMDDRGNATDVVIGDNVLIREGGKTEKFADVQPGDRVTLTNKAVTKY